MKTAQQICDELYENFDGQLGNMYISLTAEEVANVPEALTLLDEKVKAAGAAAAQAPEMIENIIGRLARGELSNQAAIGETIWALYRCIEPTSEHFFIAGAPTLEELRQDLIQGAKEIDDEILALAWAADVKRLIGEDLDEVLEAIGDRTDAIDALARLFGWLDPTSQNAQANWKIFSDRWSEMIEPPEVTA